MAAGEYVSVASQRATESADIARERQELATSPDAELEELTRLYTSRAVERRLAAQVATQLTANNALAAHARDELGLADETLSRPYRRRLFRQVDGYHRSPPRCPCTGPSTSTTASPFTATGGCRPSRRRTAVSELPTPKWSGCGPTTPCPSEPR
jgi:VIT1/CCC1 family predicted Fe2+/Mn2+ transporter